MVLGTMASLFAGYLRLTHATSRMTYEPRSNDAVFADFAPFIATCWHGQSFMLPLVRPRKYPADVLASRNVDGEIIARVVQKVGCGVIRGSGASDRARMHKKGAVTSFRAMKAALDAGRTIGMTADFQKNARRKAGPGIIALARLSGRPIMPAAFASSLRFTVGSWDETTMALPFGHAACVFGDPIWVSADADDVLLEAKRQELEVALNKATARAYEIVDRAKVAPRG